VLEVKNMTVRYGDLTIVNDVSFSVSEGQWLMIVGPNGAGKSTIINAISQGAPYTGTVLFNGEDVKKSKPRELAKNIGVLMQNHSVGYSFTVEEVIRLGRYSYSSGIFSRSHEEDNEKVREAVRMTGLEPFLKQSVLTLSGGELQRTFLAQLFAQDPKLLILDEPTNHLDLIYQKQTFELIWHWIRSTGRAVISVVHDLSLALANGTHALLLDRGKIISNGPVRDVFTEQNLKAVYSMDVYAWMRDMLRQWQN